MKFRALPAPAPSAFAEVVAQVAQPGAVKVAEVAAQPAVAAGRLVRPFDIIVPLNFAYYLVYPEPAAEVPKIAAFRDWILAEIATSI